VSRQDTCPETQSLAEVSQPTHGRVYTGVYTGRKHGRVPCTWPCTDPGVYGHAHGRIPAVYTAV